MADPTPEDVTRGWETGLLAELRAERAGHVADTSEPSHTSRVWCGACGIAYVWPCPTARALDCAIVLAEAAERAKLGEGRYSRDPFEHACNAVEDMQAILAEGLTGAAAAWKGDGA